MAGAEGVDLGSLAELFYFVIIGLFCGAAFFSLELLIGSGSKKFERKLSNDKQIALTTGNSAFTQNYRQPKHGATNQMNGDIYEKNYSHGKSEAIIILRKIIILAAINCLQLGEKLEWVILSEIRLIRSN